MDWLNSSIEYWHWMVLGLLLVASEVFVPSFVMLWFGKLFLIFVRLTVLTLFG